MMKLVQAIEVTIYPCIVGGLFSLNNGLACSLGVKRTSSYWLLQCWNLYKLKTWYNNCKAVILLWRTRVSAYISPGISHKERSYWLLIALQKALVRPPLYWRVRFWSLDLRKDILALEQVQEQESQSNFRQFIPSHRESNTFPFEKWKR